MTPGSDRTTGIGNKRAQTGHHVAPDDLCAVT